jgi:hypothetical protein
MLLEDMCKFCQACGESLTFDYRIIIRLFETID